MWSPFASFQRKRQLKQQGIKLGFALSRLRAAKMWLEPGVSISNANLAMQALHIGTRTYLRSGCELSNIASIGRFCSIGNDVILGQERSGHPLDWVSTHPFQHERPERHYQHIAPPTEIGNDVWIGREAIVMEGVRVGSGAVIGARAVVTGDVPPYAVVVGMPARVIRYRHSAEIIDKLLKSEWWTLPIEFLQSAPLESPTLFLEYLSKHPEIEPAQYPCLELTKTRCRLLSPSERIAT
jgi:chloramphenicol O-acetyltransferase type B